MSINNNIITSSINNHTIIIIIIIRLIIIIIIIINITIIIIITTTIATTIWSNETDEFLQKWGAQGYPSPSESRYVFWEKNTSLITTTIAIAPRAPARRRRPLSIDTYNNIVRGKLTIILFIVCSSSSSSSSSSSK